ncbi:MAG: hypothetical protein ACR2L2_04455 [Acidobacteriota bacterium]
MASALLGGWQIGGIWHLQSGRFLDWGNAFFYGNPDSIRRNSPTPDKWFNTDDFERNSSRVPASFHRRVFPQRIPSLTGDHMNQVDASLKRSIRITEGTRFEVRADAINVFNRVQWDNPSTDPLSSNFGRVTQQWNTPRWIQFQLRFTY